MEVHPFDRVRCISFEQGACIVLPEPMPLDLYLQQERKRRGVKVVLNRSMMADEATRQTLQVIAESLLDPNRRPVVGKKVTTDRDLEIEGCSLQVYNMVIDMVCRVYPTLLSR
jgi:hypothetical protein